MVNDDDMICSSYSVIASNIPDTLEFVPRSQRDNLQLEAPYDEQRFLKINRDFI